MSEFQRVFADTKELGDSVLAEEKYLALDADSFQVAKTIALAIEAIRKNSQAPIKMDRKNGGKSNDGRLNVRDTHSTNQFTAYLVGTWQNSF